MWPFPFSLLSIKKKRKNMTQEYKRSNISRQPFRNRNNLRNNPYAICISCDRIVSYEILLKLLN